MTTTATQHEFDYVDLSSLPEHMREAVSRYLNDGTMPGGFLAAVLRNDLVRAVTLADDKNTAALFAWAMWLYNECPDDAWGSREKVREWSLRRRRLTRNEELR